MGREGWPLAADKAVKCCVLFSKLDRLSRGVAVVAGLMAQRVPFVVAESGVKPTRLCCISTPGLPRKSAGSSLLH